MEEEEEVLLPLPRRPGRVEAPPTLMAGELGREPPKWLHETRPAGGGCTLTLEVSNLRIRLQTD